MTESKTFVYVVHGMSYQRMVEKAEEGVLPTFKKLMDDGSYGIAKSVFSTASAVDYTTMLTGASHTTHGIPHFLTDVMEGFYFSHYPRDGRLESVPPKFWNQTRYFTSYDVQVPWVWDIMEDHKAMQFGMYTTTTYPASPMPNDGVMVTGCWGDPTPFLKDHIAGCNDPEIREELLEQYPDYWISPFYGTPPFYPKDANTEEEYLHAKLELGTSQHEPAQRARHHIMTNHDWDVFLTEDPYVDQMQHLLWPRSEDNPLYDEEVDGMLHKEGLLDQYYRHTDEMLKLFLDDLPEDANVVVISNHGHEEIDYRSNTHDVFKKFYDLGKWGVPPGWEVKQEMPDWSPPNRSNHNYDGLFIAAGPDFADDGEVDPMSVMDFTPLLLDLYGYDQPEHVEGEIPAQVMADD